MLLLCHSHESVNFLETSAKIAEVIIAFINLFLAGYIFIYQIKKDRKTDSDTAQLHEQNIKLQWFKELIVQPNMVTIFSFYDNLHTIKNKINSNDLSDAEKQDINDFVKSESAKLRKSFIDVLTLVDKKFGDQLQMNIDELVDGITNSIFNDELKLKQASVYEKEIGSKISYSKSKLLAQLYNYKGLSN